MRLDEIAKQVSEYGDEKKFKYSALGHSIMSGSEPQQFFIGLCSITPFSQLPFTPKRERKGCRGSEEGDGRRGVKEIHSHALFSFSYIETALAKVISDLVVKSSECFPVLTLLDLSVTFDIEYSLRVVPLS